MVMARATPAPRLAVLTTREIGIQADLLTEALDLVRPSIVQRIRTAIADMKVDNTKEILRNQGEMLRGLKPVCAGVDGSNPKASLMGDRDRR